MQLKRNPRIALLFLGTVVRAAFAQSAEDVLKSEIKSIRYPPLAEQARIEGDVRLQVNSGVITVLSGHPLLAQVAVASAKTFGSVRSQANLDMTYHFVLVEAKISVTEATVKRGNTLERAIRRVFGMKTHQVVQEYVCEEGVAHAHDLRANGPMLEVWIYGRARCVQTNTARSWLRVEGYLCPSGPANVAVKRHTGNRPTAFLGSYRCQPSDKRTCQELGSHDFVNALRTRLVRLIG
jgi:hypothetical protein